VLIITINFLYNTVLFNLGRAYHFPIGVDQDFKKANKLYEMAVEKGNSGAMNSLAMNYKKDLELIKTIKKQINYMKWQLKKEIQVQ